MTLKFACESNEATAWIAVLLGPEVPHKVAPHKVAPHKVAPPASKA
jgi:hypothetical protein